MRIFQFTIFISLCISVSPLLLTTIFQIVGIAKDISSIIKIGEMIYQDQREMVLLDKMDVTNRKIEKVANQIDSLGLDVAGALLRNIPANVRFELKTNDLMNYISRINISYKKMGFYLANRSAIEKATLEDFARSVISHNSDSIQFLLEHINNYVVPLDIGLSDTSILKVLENLLADPKATAICDMNSSPQQTLMNFYNTILLTELKGYSMVQFSYMILKEHNKGNFTAEIEIMQKNFNERAQRSLKVISDALKTAPRKYWRCDPKTFIKGQNYIELTELLQGYIENEVDLNREGTCFQTCAEQSYTKSNGCYMGQFCQHQRKCNGKIINCKYIYKDMSVCLSKPNSGKRYDYVQYDNGRVLGNKQECYTVRAESWWRWLFWHCSYCMCLCDEQGTNSDRYFNLRPTLSNVTKNMVITGARFVKHNRIIHIQIQEGKLGKNAEIDPTTLNWVPVDNYMLTGKGIKEKVDYHILAWEKRALDLDELIAQKQNEILTGVRFKIVGGHLNLEILLTPYNYKTGELKYTMSHWLDNLISPRRKIILDNSDVPTKVKSPNVPDSRNGDYIEFTHTSFDADVAQNTIPFIDSQNVETNVPLPLSGLGIYHKGVNSFGGFIGLNIFTYDFSEIVNADVVEAAK